MVAANNKKEILRTQIKEKFNDISKKRDDENKEN
jgi:hypothetical protein